MLRYMRRFHILFVLVLTSFTFNIAASQNDECVSIVNRFLDDSTRVSDDASVTARIPEVTPRNGLIRNLTEEEEAISKDIFNGFKDGVKDAAVLGKFKLLVDPKESLMSKIMLIRNAKSTIDLTYYIFQKSEASDLLLDELRQALKRGVSIRMMVDGTGSISQAPLYKQIQALSLVKGGQIRDEAGAVIGRASFDFKIINPVFNIRARIAQFYRRVIALITGKNVPVNEFTMLNRSHDKILLIDAQSAENSMAIIGGRNMSNHYYSIGTQKEIESTFNDLEVFVKDIAFVKKDKDGKDYIHNVLEEHYNRLYFYLANKSLKEFIFKLGDSNAIKQLKKIKKSSRESLSTEGQDLGKILSRMTDEDFLNKDLDNGWVSFLNDIQNLNRGSFFGRIKNAYKDNKDSIVENFFEQIKQAKKNITLCSPYIFFKDSEMDDLVLWLKEDKSRTIRLITNSSATSDNLFAQSMVEYFVMPKLLEKLKKAGVHSKQYEILAYGNLENKELGGTKNQGKLHAKFWMIDNFTQGVGTSNFDPISRLANSEIQVNIFPLSNDNNSTKQLEVYYSSLKNNSASWNSEEFYTAKAHKSLKTKLMIQSILAKMINYFEMLPQ